MDSHGLNLNNIQTKVKNATGNILWFAEKNIIFTKNILMEKLDFSKDSSSRDKYLQERIDNLNQMKETYDDLRKALMQLIPNYAGVSTMRTKIGNVLKSTAFKENSGLMDLCEVAGDLYLFLGEQGLQHKEKVQQLHDGIGTFLDKAIKETIDAANKHHHTFEEYRALHQLKEEIKNRPNSDPAKVAELEKRLEVMHTKYQETVEELDKKMKFLQEASNEKLCEAFEKFVEDLGEFYDKINEKFELMEENGIPLIHHGKEVWEKVSK